MSPESDKATFAVPMKGKSDDTFLSEMLQRFSDAQAFDRNQRWLAKEDMRFAFEAGQQWDKWMLGTRKGRPNYEFNRVRQSIRQVLGDQLQNRPSLKVRAADNGDKEIAEIRQGLLKSIERQSHAEQAYDHAFMYALGGGMGFWRIETAYADDMSFDQDIFIREVRNPYSVWFDPSATSFDRRDALYAFVEDRVSRQEFAARWPKAQIVDFSGDNQGDALWWYQNEVRICEYWYKVPEKRTIFQLSDGRVVEEKDYAPVADELQEQGITIVDQRETEVMAVKQCLVSGKEVLEGPHDWPGKFIPLVVVWGDLLNIDGVDLYSGMTRFAKDAQRLHNFMNSTAMEVVAKAPKAPITATPAMIKGLESHYENMAIDDAPVLLYNADPAAPGARPMREQAAQFPIGLAQMANIAADEIKATLGIHNASLGMEGNETSGKAILARQREGDTANYVYFDNFSKSLRYSGEIINDLLPKVITTERTLRILGEDGAEKFVEVNKSVLDEQTGQWVTLNDLNQGRYDIAVTIGPSYSTQRMETADAMRELAQSPGPMGLVAQYTMLKALDTPGTDEFIAAARKILITQGLLEPNEKEQASMKPQPPAPEVVAKVELMGAQTELAKAKAADTIAKIPSGIMKSQAEADHQAALAFREQPNMQTPPDQMTAPTDSGAA